VVGAGTRHERLRLESAGLLLLLLLLVVEERL